MDLRSVGVSRIRRVLVFLSRLVFAGLAIPRIVATKNPPVNTGLRLTCSILVATIILVNKPRLLSTTGANDNQRVSQTAARNCKFSESRPVMERDSDERTITREADSG